MAENKFKKKSESTSSKPKTAVNLKLPQLTMLQDPRLKLAFGSFLLVFSVALGLAMLSYLFTGQDDQSIMLSYWADDIDLNGKIVKNVLGLLGASLSHFFIYKWFGLGAFLLVPILLFKGIKILFNKEFPFMKNLVNASLFLVFWLGLCTGYFVVALHAQGLMFVCGGIGYELAEFMVNVSGVGTVLFLVLSALIFSIYFFDVRSLSMLGAETKETEFGSAEDTAFGDEAEKIRSEVDVAEEEEPEPELVLKEQEEELLLEEAIEPLTNEIEEEELALELTVETPEPVEESPFGSQELIVESPVVEEGVEEEPAEEEIIEVEIGERVEEEVSNKDTPENYDPTLDLSGYEFPGVDLLMDYPESKVKVTREELEVNKNNIVTTLGNYKIGIKSIKATIGPTVTLYEIVPEAGVKISKIKNLEDDIALSLAALGIRIIAPIPGKGTIGIEVPNKNRELVSIRSLITTEKFMKSDMALPVVFGKTISNEIFMIDLAKMPHLLMAGATGQGKSVGLNMILASLLYKKHPSQLKMVLVDPKKVELSIFSHIEKHFLAKLPDSEEAIITDTTKVVNTLNSLCIEMDTRYDLFKRSWV